MFELSINKEKQIQVYENGNIHFISTFMSHWNKYDLLCHWKYGLYDLLKCYAEQYIFLSMSVESEQGYLRAFRTVRTRNLIVSDDVRFAVPWKARSWNPIESIEYALSSRGRLRLDHSFNSADRIPELLVSPEEIDEFLHKKLEPEVPDNYVSEFKLYHS
jgi:hypothetical protein